MPSRVTLFHEDSLVSSAEAEIVTEVDVSEENQTSVAVDNGGRRTAPTSTEGGAGCAGATTQNINSHLPPPVLAVGGRYAESLAGVPGGIPMIPTIEFGGSGSLSSLFFLHDGAYGHVYAPPPYIPPPPHHGMALYHHPAP
ncbi:hypothetical protein ACA910_014370 [Epithemia clementina (nom. ined.)]